LQVKESITSGLEWLLRSGIQNRSFDEGLGGFAAWYDMDKKTHSFVYSEITGYALNLLLSLKRYRPSKRLDEAIDLATYYLTNLAFDRTVGAVRCRFLAERGWLENFCTFDNIIVANALINKHRMDKDREALRTATRILDYLMGPLCLGDGFYARYIGKAKRFQNDPLKWSTGSGSFHAKAAIPLLNMYDLTGAKRYLDLTKKLIPGILKHQDKFGRFITDASSKDTFLHPHLYTLEGLVVAERYLKNPAITSAIVKGMDWCKTMRMGQGGIAGYYTGDGKKIESDSADINSQYLRLLLLRGTDPDDGYVKSLVQRILNFQKDNPNDKRTFGGFQIGDIWFYDHVAKRFDHFKNHINTWAAVFALNAFQYHDGQDKEQTFTIC
jgi:hypothetical protein